MTSRHDTVYVGELRVIIPTHCSELSLYGALKRLYEWDNAFVTVSACNEDQSLPAEDEAFAANLGASITVAERIAGEKSWPVWQGKVSLAGSQVITIVLTSMPSY